jgi:hypothetical protein
VIPHGDLVLIPKRNSKYFILGEVQGKYEFNPNNPIGLYHKRKIRIMDYEIEREWFPQNIQYSMRTYRTIFCAHPEEEILEIIKRKSNGYRNYKK